MSLRKGFAGSAARGGTGKGDRNPGNGRAPVPSKKPGPIPQ